MLKKGFVGLITLCAVLGVASMAFAADESAKASGMWIFFAIAIGCGICPQFSDLDPYAMALAAIDEAVRGMPLTRRSPA